jgi:hypothetical protein
LTLRNFLPIRREIIELLTSHASFFQLRLPTIPDNGANPNRIVGLGFTSFFFVGRPFYLAGCVALPPIARGDPLVGAGARAFSSSYRICPDGGLGAYGNRAFPS